MWKKIDIVEIIIDADQGTIISQYPNDTSKNYKILSHSNQHIEAMSVNGIPTLTVFNDDKLISDVWWVKN
jgi:hypothetical protein